MREIRKLLDSLTMYQLIEYGLFILIFISLVFSALGVLSTSFWGILFSVVLFIGIGGTVNVLIGKALGVAATSQSGLITCLILICIMPPTVDWKHALYNTLAVLFAIASKFVIARNMRHLFNPAGFGAACVTILGLSAATWWIGAQALFPFLLIFSVAIAVKLRHWRLIGTFVAISVITTVVVAVHDKFPVSGDLKILFLSSPLLFLGSVMLTEPTTLAVNKRWQLGYAAVVGILSAGHFKLGGTFISPIYALLIGNVLSYTINPKRNYRLVLQQIEPLANGLYRLRFKANVPLGYQAGQYMEWTIPITGKFDQRGNRRTFSIASAPEDDEVVLGIRLPRERASDFKKKLLDLKPGAIIQGSYVAGNFTLPSKPEGEQVLVAGGIGITPFLSMLRSEIASQRGHKLSLYYLVRTPEDVFDTETLRLAKAAGIAVNIVVSDPAEGVAKALEAGLINQHPGATYYVSGAPPMVDAVKAALVAGGITRAHVKTDRFTGY